MHLQGHSQVKRTVKINPTYVEAWYMYNISPDFIYGLYNEKKK